MEMTCLKKVTQSMPVWLLAPFMISCQASLLYDDPIIAYRSLARYFALNVEAISERQGAVCQVAVLKHQVQVTENTLMLS